MNILEGKTIVKKYTFFGKETESDENCFAKEVYNRELKNNYYYVKIGVNGYSKGMYYNPYNIQERTEFDFTKVNQSQFDLYLRFLRTKSERYLITMRK